MSARIIFAKTLAIAHLAAGALGCGSRSPLEWTGVDGGAFRDARMDPVRRDATPDALADRSVDAAQERSGGTLDASRPIDAGQIDASQPFDAGRPIDASPPIDACLPTCAGRACGANDGCGGRCAVGICPNGLRCAAAACVCDPMSCAGCCSANRCLPGTDRSACGADGLLCKACPLGECANGTCLVGSETEITLFGGSGARGFVGDTWTWDGNAWRKQPVTGPSPRYGPAMALLRGKNVLFGGAGYVDGSFMAFDQTYEWDGTSWTVRNVPGPSPRWVHTMATLNDKIVLFGGFNGREYLGDTWEWNGDTWTQRMVQGPPKRGRHAMATVKGKVVLFAGQNNDETLNDTWEWDGNAWTKHDVSPSPGARTGHAMASLPDKAVLVSGAHLGEYFLETWEWDGRSWTERKVNGPSRRAVAAMASLQGKVVLFGGVVVVGSSMYEYLTDTWEWDGNTWTDRKVSGPIGVADAAMSSR